MRSLVSAADVAQNKKAENNKQERANNPRTAARQRLGANEQKERAVYMMNRYRTRRLIANDSQFDQKLDWQFGRVLDRAKELLLVQGGVDR